MEDETPRISKEQLAAALAKIVRPCPMCGGAKWETNPGNVALWPSSDDVGPALYLSTGDDDSDSFEAVSVVAVLCQNCGFIAPFLLETLLQNAEQ